MIYLAGNIHPIVIVLFTLIAYQLDMYNSCLLACYPLAIKFIVTTAVVDRSNYLLSCP